MAPVKVGSRTDVGRVRALNEDAFLVGRRAWLVADGMGGHAAGDIASALVVRRMRELDEADALDPATVIATITRANEDVLAYGTDHPESWGLGSTVSGVCEVHVGGAPHWAVFNVGDSRVYRFWRGELSRATVDHSETEEMVLAGQITEQQARTHHRRNIITRSIGTPGVPQVDLWVLPQSGGERFLICSDGLTSELDDEQIASVLREEPDPANAVDSLVEGALQAGARDNVTVLVVDVEGHGSDGADENTNPRERQS